MRCNNNTELVIPRGNDFRLHLRLADVAPANPSGVTFADVEGLKVYIVRFPGIRAEVPSEVTENGDLIVSVPATVQLPTKYGIELTGTYNGNVWRFKCSCVFTLADSNCESTVQGMESFGVETYYLFDTLDFEIVGDTLHIYTDGHASLDDGTLSLQETDGTLLEVAGDSIIATETQQKHR